MPYKNIEAQNKHYREQKREWLKDENNRRIAYARSAKWRKANPQWAKRYNQILKRLGLCNACHAPTIRGISRCVRCMAKQANKKRERLYGLTAERYVDLLFEQYGKCAICNRYFAETPHVDHNKATGKYRSLLCVKCNVGLYFFEDEVIFSRMLKYKKENEDGHGATGSEEVLS